MSNNNTLGSYMRMYGIIFLNSLLQIEMIHKLMNELEKKEIKHYKD